jgi:hypothetical protein
LEKETGIGLKRNLQAEKMKWVFILMVMARFMFAIFYESGGHREGG